MDIISRVMDLKTSLKQTRLKGKTIALVPTMGYLHDGHLALMRQAKMDHDLVVVSIFVNPLQFGPQEDYQVYPRDLNRDAELAAAAGVDILFTPLVGEMYPRGHQNMLTFVDVHALGERLCGVSRPDHFRGVATVVAKLFHIVEPDGAYFGQKDAQQVIVIERMVEDLNINVKVVAVPTVREADGLALSSRNIYLSSAERQAAQLLYKSLDLAKEKLGAGERDAAVIVSEMRRILAVEPLIKIDYISVSDPADLAEQKIIKKTALVALAAQIGRTRLIDNMIWRESAGVNSGADQFAG